MQSTGTTRRWWTKGEDEVLRREAELQLSRGVLKNWSAIATTLPGRTNKDCRKRWSKVSEPAQKGAWSPTEDDRLRNAVSQYGLRWILVAQYVGTRHADQCAKRWQHSLDPSIDHGEWAEDEDARLLEAVSQFGNHWGAIRVKEFPDRSTTDLKNRHISVRRKQQRAAKVRRRSQSIHHSRMQTNPPPEALNGDDGDFEDDEDEVEREEYGMEAVISEPFPGDSRVTPFWEPSALTVNSTTTSDPSSLSDIQHDPAQCPFIPGNDLSFPFSEQHFKDDFFMPTPPTSLSPFSQLSSSSPTPLTPRQSFSTSITPPGTTTPANQRTTINPTSELPPSPAVAIATSHYHADPIIGSHRSILILEDVQPDTVSMVLTTLLKSGTTFRARVEHTEQRKSVNG